MIYLLLKFHLATYYPKPSNPAACTSYAACVRQLHEINGDTIGGNGMGPRK